MMETKEASEPVKVTFSKYDGGKMALSQGTLLEILPDSIRVAYVDAEGNRSNVRFNRAPGSKAGWGVGVSRHWRISDDERKKYCHPDIPKRLR